MKLQVYGRQNLDFVRLCNMMKDELNHMGNIEGKVVHGLLAEGNEYFCEMYYIFLSK